MADERLITQEERLGWAELDAKRHVGQLAGSCFCNVCTLLEEIHTLRARLAAAQEAREMAQARVKEMEALVTNAAVRRYEALAKMEYRAEQAERDKVELLGVEKKLLDEVEQAEVQVARLRAALNNVAARTDPDGQRCWCAWLVDHAHYCQRTRSLLAEPGA